MPRRWLLKSEPGDFSFDDLVAAGEAGEIWDGVRNHQAAGFLREMARGEDALFYHSGRSPAVVGIARILEAAFPDPTDATGRFVAVRVQAREALNTAVPLATIKASRACGDFLLVRHPRLSVMPVPEAAWQWILKRPAAGR